MTKRDMRSPGKKRKRRRKRKKAMHRMSDGSMMMGRRHPR